MADVAVLTTAGQRVNRIVDITAIIWVGATTAADSVVLKEIGGDRIWEGRATGDNTYQGIRFDPDGLHVNAGIEVESISSARLYVYFREA